MSKVIYINAIFIFQINYIYLKCDNVSAKTFSRNWDRVLVVHFDVVHPTTHSHTHVWVDWTQNSIDRTAIFVLMRKSKLQKHVNHILYLWNKIWDFNEKVWKRFIFAAIDSLFPLVLGHFIYIYIRNGLWSETFNRSLAISFSFNPFSYHMI